MRIFKAYKSPFVVETSKINRLMSVVRENFTRLKVPSEEHFEVVFAGGRHFATNSLEEVFQLDNSKGTRISEFSIRCFVDAKDRQGTANFFAEFDSAPPTGVRLSVGSNDAKWAADLFSSAEEQIERTFQTSMVLRLKSSPFVAFAPILVALVLLSAGLALTLGQVAIGEDLERTMC